MKAMLAQKWYGLATGWGARPAWQLHHMALGKSIGYSHLRTVNNGTLTFGGAETLEYTPTGTYTFLNPIWVNLLGDPTLHPFPTAPVTKLQAEMLDGDVRLTWNNANGGTERQYRVYRALDRSGPYQALNPSKLHFSNQFIDPDPVPGAWYMVRAHSLQEVYAGSFYSFSQGVFATLDNLLPRASDVTLSTPMGQEIAINLTAIDLDPGNNLITSIVKGPDGGYLSQSKGEWSFIPDPDFKGQAMIPFTVFDGIASDEGIINIQVVEP